MQRRDGAASWQDDASGGNTFPVDVLYTMLRTSMDLTALPNQHLALGKFMTYLCVARRKALLAAGFLHSLRGLASRLRLCVLTATWDPASPAYLGRQRGLDGRQGRAVVNPNSGASSLLETLTF